MAARPTVTSPDSGVAESSSLPAWAEWNRDPDAVPFSVGVEEEVMLLDPADWSLAHESHHVLEELPDRLTGHVSAETQGSILEITTGVHTTVAGAVSELRDLRRDLRATLAA